MLDQQHRTNLENNAKAQSRGVIESIVLLNPNDARDQTFAVFIVDEPFDFNVIFIAPVCLEFPFSVSRGNDGAPIEGTGLVFAPHLRDQGGRTY